MSFYDTKQYKGYTIIKETITEPLKSDCEDFDTTVWDWRVRFYNEDGTLVYDDYFAHEPNMRDYRIIEETL